MISKEQDIRGNRTRKLIQNSLIELIARKGFETITVGDIATHAMINRSTFYRYFQDKYDLMTQIFEEASNQLVDEIKPSLIQLLTVDEVDTPEGWIRFFNHIAENRVMYQTMLGNYGNPWFVLKIRNCLSDIIKKRIHAFGSRKSVDNIPEEVLTSIIANCCVGTISWWLESKDPVPPAQIAQWLSEFLIHGYLYTVDKRNLHSTI